MDLNFIPEKGPPATATVQPDGKFQTEVVTGPAKVIVLLKGAGGAHGQHGQGAKDAKAAGVLSKYTDNYSPLSIEVPEGGKTDLTIEVGQ
jgi:hypothetical protein